MKSCMEGPVVRLVALLVNDTKAIMLVIVLLKYVVIFLNLMSLLFFHIALKVTMIEALMIRDH